MASCTHCLHLLYKPRLIHFEFFLFNQQTTSKTDKYKIVGDFCLLINKRVEFLDSRNQPCITTTLILQAIVPFFFAPQCLTFCDSNMKIIKLLYTLITKLMFCFKPLCVPLNYILKLKHNSQFLLKLTLFTFQLFHN
jgi:hypothetical protein